MRPLIAAALLALATALPAQAGKPDLTVKVAGDGSWATRGIRYDRAGDLVLIVKPVAHQGRVAICGLVVPEIGNTSVGRMGYEMILDTRILLGKTQLIPNPDHFPLLTIRDKREIIGAAAGCTLTKVPATPDLMKQPLTMESRKGWIYD